MTQHYPRNTVSASEWCAKCGKNTQHRIDDRRVGPCLECLKAPAKPTSCAADDRMPVPEQACLFAPTAELPPQSCPGCGATVWIGGLCRSCLEEREHHVVAMVPAQ